MITNTAIQNPLDVDDNNNKTQTQQIVVIIVGSICIILLIIFGYYFYSQRVKIIQKESTSIIAVDGDNKINEEKEINGVIVDNDALEMGTINEEENRTKLIESDGNNNGFEAKTTVVSISSSPSATSNSDTMFTK